MTTCPATSTNSVANLHAAWTRLSQSGLAADFLAALPPRASGRWGADFETFAAAHQKEPAAARNGAPWSLWLVLGGRGAGKTRAGAEWVKTIALQGRARRIALVGETMADLREVMVEGVSGLRAIHARHERPVWQATRRRLEWPNGAIAQGFSAEDPESLRGPQFDAAWCDELAKWKQPEAAFDMLQFGLRLGSHPRQVITTTPRPIALLRRLAADPAHAVTHAGTLANAANLAPAFLSAVMARYAGTALGRQELDGQFVEDNPDALFPRAALESARVEKAPDLARIVVAVDPPAGGRRGGRCGIVVAGIGADGAFYVLEDCSLEAARPESWGAKALAAFHAHQADALVVEVNQGGDMAKAVFAALDASVPVTAVRAMRGKVVRAEPVAALYAQGRVRHVGAFPALEDEMAAFAPDGSANGRSPDRLDALVWALTHLSAGAGAPRVRGL